MIWPLGRLGAAVTLGQHCPQMTHRPGKFVLHQNGLTISLPTQGFVAASLVLVRSLGVRGGLPEELGHGGEVLVLELSHVFVVTLNLFIEGFF